VEQIHSEESIDERRGQALISVSLMGRVWESQRKVLINKIARQWGVPHHD
jgi:hypothetical protein